MNGASVSSAEAPKSALLNVAAATAESMRQYYAQRAATYEGIYAKPERQGDLAALHTWLPPHFAGRRGLEIACGTGYWTPHAAAHGSAWLATDVNDEVLAIARAKPLPPCVALRRVDAYTLAELEPHERFDAALAAFWWSHVPRAHLSNWLTLMHTRLQPGAVVVMIDNCLVAGSSTPVSRTDADGNTYQLRTLADGSTHEVLKNFPHATDAMAALGCRARDAQWLRFGHYWALRYQLA